MQHIVNVFAAELATAAMKGRSVKESYTVAVERAASILGETAETVKAALPQEATFKTIAVGRTCTVTFSRHEIYPICS
jgi:uncharacterized protein YfaS (alpha-2-macroglobulin family)